MSEKNIDLDFADLASAVELSQQEVESIQSLAQAVAEVIASSPFPDVDPDTYFIWMYSVEPFAEA